MLRQLSECHCNLEAKKPLVVRRLQAIEFQGSKSAVLVLLMKPIPLLMKRSMHN